MTANSKQGMRLLASPERLAEAIARRGVGLEDELGTYLTDTTRCSRGGITELAAVSIADHTARKEVGMVEDVEHLEAQVQCHCFGDFRVFLQTQIRADPSRSAEGVLRRAASHATNFVTAAKATGEG